MTRKSLLPLNLPQHCQPKSPSPKIVTLGKITLAMLVRNESGCHLERVLAQTTEYIDHAVILDDASEDNTIELCQEILQGIPLTLFSNKELSYNEILLRRQLWEMALSTNPEWIVILDADELFEENAPKQLRELLEHSTQVDYLSFRLYDLWTETQYRDDPLWQAHKWYRPFIVRNIPNFQANGKNPPNIAEDFLKILPSYVEALALFESNTLAGSDPKIDWRNIIDINNSIPMALMVIWNNIAPF